MEKEEVLKPVELKVHNEKRNVLQNVVKVEETSILIGDLAKLIKQNGYDIGQNRLFAWLRENGYLIKSGERRNLPTQKAMELEILEIKQRIINSQNGTTRIIRTTRVTGKGQLYFINKFLKINEKGKEKICKNS